MKGNRQRIEYKEEDQERISENENKTRKDSIRTEIGKTMMPFCSRQTKRLLSML